MHTDIHKRKQENCNDLRLGLKKASQQNCVPLKTFISWISPIKKTFN
jgi:hypothetical protein